MLRVSKLADYAVMIVFKFVQQPEKLYSATELVSLTSLNLPTLRKILKLLSAQKVLTAKRGAEGGYFLTKEYRSLSILTIVEAIDGQLTFTECCEENFTSCSVGMCEMKSPWQVINQTVRQSLGTFLIEDLHKKMQVKSNTDVKMKLK